jgi:hypothetical protein
MKTTCARVTMLAAVLSGAVPIAAHNQLNGTADANRADSVATYKHLQPISHHPHEKRQEIDIKRETKR